MSKKSITVAAEETDEFEIDVSFENGPSCNVKFTFPKDQAIVALHAIRKLAEEQSIGGLLSVLREDPSVAKSLADNHLYFDNEDDDL